jgi:pSer/pThr/pTyr-binding forkhead associated (FHA) protein
MTAKLITHEKDNERNFVVTEAGLTIGRHADNQASLDDSRLSRFHARIKFKDGAWYAEDLGSTNGSFLNSLPLVYKKPYRLKPMDVIRFASESYIFY